MDGEIIFNIDVMLAKRKMSVTELANKVGITIANISVLKNGKAKAIRVSTLAKLCEALDCQPADLLEYRKNEKWQKIPLSLERGVLFWDFNSHKYYPLFFHRSFHRYRKPLQYLFYL